MYPESSTLLHTKTESIKIKPENLRNILQCVSLVLNSSQKK